MSPSPSLGHHDRRSFLFFSSRAAAPGIFSKPTTLRGGGGTFFLRSAERFASFDKEEFASPAPVRASAFPFYYRGRRGGFFFLFEEGGEVVVCFPPLPFLLPFFYNGGTMTDFPVDGISSSRGAASFFFEAWSRRLPPFFLFFQRERHLTATAVPLVDKACVSPPFCARVTLSFFSLSLSSER